MILQVFFNNDKTLPMSQRRTIEIVNAKYVTKERGSILMNYWYCFAGFAVHSYLTAKHRNCHIFQGSFEDKKHRKIRALIYCFYLQVANI